MNIQCDLRDDGSNQRLDKWFKLDKEAKKVLTEGIINSRPDRSRGEPKNQEGGEKSNG